MMNILEFFLMPSLDYITPHYAATEATTVTD